MLKPTTGIAIATTFDLPAVAAATKTMQMERCVLCVWSTRDGLGRGAGCGAAAGGCDCGDFGDGHEQQ